MTGSWKGVRIAVIAYPYNAVGSMAKGTQRVLESYGFERLEQ